MGVVETAKGWLKQAAGRVKRDRQMQAEGAAQAGPGVEHAREYEQRDAPAAEEAAAHEDYERRQQSDS
jgi:uncharacterized protein YjbJ (UPF0337 family)